MRQCSGVVCAVWDVSAEDTNYLIARVVAIAIVELLCPFSSPGRTCKPKCWWFFFFPRPFSRALQKLWCVLFMCELQCFWKIRVCFELQNFIAISELETTYTDIQGFFVCKWSFFWWLLMEDACAYGVAKFAVLLTFVFVIWHVGVWDEWAGVKMPIVWWGRFYKKSRN